MYKKGLYIHKQILWNWLTQPVLATADGSARTPLPVISPTINKHEVKTVKPDSFESELCDLIY